MINIGIICPSEIALRRFMPALSKVKDFNFIGVAYADKSEWEGANDEIIENEKIKASLFVEQYGGKLFNSYSSLINSNEVDAIYFPLPPSLHYYWGKKALLSGKHILLEKPATTKIEDTIDIIETARNNNLAVHENYMFIFHNQITEINNIISSGKIGDVRLYRISFGFPRREKNDFRYIKKLGGGALLDAGGYTIKYASMLLGGKSKIVQAKMNYIDEFDVDIFGSAVLMNENGTIAQISFGMDNSYKCDLEVWGSKGSLFSGRVLTAPEGFIPEIEIKIGNDIELISLTSDDAFMKSIQYFQKTIINNIVRNDNYLSITKQASLIDEFLSNNN
ncbi:MAG: N-acetylglucosamine transferase [Bacteroidetes bacterium]|nr:N-acetylglucosamine transferase [Bacteroidota bacterium]